MKLTAKQDIDAPADYVFAQLTDFESWERGAMRRGAEVSRTDKMLVPGVGMTWAAKFRYRGRDRNVSLRLDRMDADGHVGFTAGSPQADGVTQMELVAMAAKRSRVFINLEVQPKSFTAKLFVQSLKLAKSRVDRSLAQRAQQFAQEIEDRYKRSLQR